MDESSKPAEVRSMEGLGGLVEKLRSPWHHADCRSAAAEIERLRGEREVFVRWIREALLCVETIDPDDQEDGGEHHRMFMDSGQRLVTPNV